MKMRKKVIGTLLIATMFLGIAKPCSASEGITASVTETVARGTFTYGNGGTVLKIVMGYTEKHPTTGDEVSNTVENTRAGADTSVAVSRIADAGYKYTRANFWGYAGGVLRATLNNVTP